VSTATEQPELGAVFAALADPTRRAVVQSLAGGTTVTASALARELPITRQAIAKHLTALDHAGLVACERRGRETHYRLTPEPLTEAAGWMAAVGAQWDDRLAALRTHLTRR
jgi:DNA-binding transcriptional ArsR family regulator